MKKKRKKKISQLIQRGMFLVVILAFIITSVITFVLQNMLAKQNTERILKLNTKDIEQSIDVIVNRNWIDICWEIAYYDLEMQNIKAIDSIKSQEDIPDADKNEVIDDSDINAYLAYWQQEYGVTELNIVSQEGIILCSTNSDYLNFDMTADTAENEQAKSFYDNMMKYENYVQEYRDTSYDETLGMQYAGVRLSDDCFLSGGGGFLQVGYNAENLAAVVSYYCFNLTYSRHIGENGKIYLALENEEKLIVYSETDRNILLEDDLFLEDETGLDLKSDSIKAGTIFQTKINDKTCYCMYEIYQDFYILATYPKSEAVLSRNISVMLLIFMELLVFVLLFMIIYYLIKKLVVDNILRVNSKLTQIADGNLEVEVDVCANEEFSMLSDDINTTVGTLKCYINEVEERMKAELEIAKVIQYSALPSIFPPYPFRDEFEIWAGMEAAKNVGGDFYDFYLLGEDTLVFLVADVSGKGIPAAMFMMIAKTTIKSLAESGMDVDEVFEHANNKLCENNDANMFVTAWMGKINLKTGMVSYANAGHNLPLVCRTNGEFDYLVNSPDLVLAALEDIKYSRNELQLHPGDKIYLYTDGVTEAINEKEELFGGERLKNILNIKKEKNVQDLCQQVRKEMNQFTGTAPQFDDITMLALELKRLM